LDSLQDYTRILKKEKYFYKNGAAEYANPDEFQFSTKVPETVTHDKR
jgi:uncharacterized protein YecE (DUF72 family)